MPNFGRLGWVYWSPVLEWAEPIIINRSSKQGSEMLDRNWAEQQTSIHGCWPPLPARGSASCVPCPATLRWIRIRCPPYVALEQGVVPTIAIADMSLRDAHAWCSLTRRRSWDLGKKRDARRDRLNNDQIIWSGRRRAVLDLVKEMDTIKSASDRTLVCLDFGSGGNNKTMKK